MNVLFLEKIHLFSLKGIDSSSLKYLKTQRRPLHFGGFADGPENRVGEEQPPVPVWRKRKQNVINSESASCYPDVSWAKSTPRNPVSVVVPLQPA